MNHPIFKEVTEKEKSVWKQFRETLYQDVTDSFHETEMDLILKSEIQTTFLIFESQTGSPIGMLELSLRNLVDGCLTSPVAYIEGIYLDQSCRGKGYGEKMVEFSKSWAIQNGCSELACDAELEDIDAQKFHKKMGFEETYKVVQYKMVL